MTLTHQILSKSRITKKHPRNYTHKHVPLIVSLGYTPIVIFLVKPWLSGISQVINVDCTLQPLVQAYSPIPPVSVHCTIFRAYKHSSVVGVIPFTNGSHGVCERARTAITMRCDAEKRTVKLWNVFDRDQTVLGISPPLKDETYIYSNYVRVCVPGTYSKFADAILSHASNILSIKQHHLN